MYLLVLIYAKALDDLFAFCASQPLSGARLMEWREGMESLSPRPKRREHQWIGPGPTAV